jgi:ribose/xylose/arabinose/galactoside ABC-type transport system permease subunit
MSKFGTLLILFTLILIMTVIKGTTFLSPNNLFNIVRQQSIIAIMSLGVMLTIITAGIDISGGSVVSLCGCVVALLAHPVPGNSDIGQYPLIVPILGGILAGGFCGLINGWFVAYGNVPPFIATLGMMTAARGMALIVSNGKPINGFTSAFEIIGRGRWIGIPVPIFILVGATIVMYFVLHRSKFGVYVYAIGGNEQAARVSGINVKRVKTFVYVIAGLFTGFASVILTSRTLAGNPSFGVSYEMDAITGAVIGGASFSGGVGKVVNTLTGAMIIGVLTNGMTMLKLDPNAQMIARGLVIVLAVLIDQRKNRRY